MGSLRMQTLNIEAAKKYAIEIGPVAGPPSGGDTSTPLSLNTPDILNSLISITSNPFFDSSTSTDSQPKPLTATDSTISLGTTPYSEEDKKVFATLEAPPSTSSFSPLLPTESHNINNNINNCPSNSPLISNSPLPSTVQSLRSQFIKDSLKLTIQSKRRSSGKSELDVKAELLEPKIKKKEELTPEDEERRKRRRERNKVAATKCRNKKKEKTGLLVTESQVLETDNVTLKSEISKLEAERQKLTEILASHTFSCKLNKSDYENVSEMKLAISATFDASNSYERPISNSSYYQYHIQDSPHNQHHMPQRIQL